MSHRETPALFVFFLLQTRPAWLAKTPTERDRFMRDTLLPLLDRRRGVKLRYFDAEAYSAAVTDVLMWQVTVEADYRALVEDLRETRFWGHYFDVLQILPTVEDGFATHYRVPGFSALLPQEAG
jgi:hypothetical protein